MSFQEQNLNGVVYMTTGTIGAAHCFTTRWGGVSEGIFESLNLAENREDDPYRVRENFDRICSAICVEPERLVFSNQVHGDTIRRATEEDIHTLFTPVPYEADALFTDEKELPLIIFTADCVPILLWDGVRGAVAAVHAGWRGTAMDIAGKTVLRMEDELGCRPENLRAAIGPCISACCFETDSDVPEAMRKELGVVADRFITNLPGGKFSVDLKGINAFLLRRAGLDGDRIDISSECTSCKCDKYWSHRKANGQRGSQAAIIMLKG
ncbi:MAG: peptidoglycan editing factor PgeF [Oscillospiraceae bacterium]|nr:peptidoglycan editing factor PgeF [Oscillospiraceae bacterium]